MASYVSEGRKILFFNVQLGFAKCHEVHFAKTKLKNEMWEGDEHNTALCLNRLGDKL